MAKPVILVVAPMPVFPTSSGSRRRLLATCQFLKQAGFDIDFAYLAHEDQIYHRFAQEAPTDMEEMAGYFRRVWLIELAGPIKLKTGASAFELDDWCPQELSDFVAWYFAQTWSGTAILVNYVFLSACLLEVPSHILKIVDTHDRFSDRRNQYLPFRLAPNFFYTNSEAEKHGLSRADVVVAIQPAEQEYFRTLIGADIALLMPDISLVREVTNPGKLEHIGFMGHGNDANLVSISRFASAWQKTWKPGLPVLIVAGEICKSLPSDMGPGIEMKGYVEKLDTFFDAVDIVIAPMLMGTGLKLKVVEALAYGKPVIGTSIAFEGLNASSPDHKFSSISKIVERLKQLSANVDDMAKLAKDSRAAFSDYRIAVKRGERELAQELLKIATPVSSNPPDGFPMVAVGSQVESFGRLSIHTSSGLSSTPGEAALNEILLATEFLPTANDGWIGCSSPYRRRWWGRLDEIAANTDYCPDIFGKAKISVSPLFFRNAENIEQEKLKLAAIAVLATAKPDWCAVAGDVFDSENRVSINFSGPSFLSRRGVFQQAYILYSDHCASSIKDISFSALMSKSFPSASMSARCGDSSLLPFVLSGRFDDGLLQGGKKMLKLLVMSDGICGHVSLL